MQALTGVYCERERDLAEDRVCVNFREDPEPTGQNIEPRLRGVGRKLKSNSRQLGETWDLHGVSRAEGAEPLKSA